MWLSYFLRRQNAAGVAAVSYSQRILRSLRALISRTPINSVKNLLATLLTNSRENYFFQHSFRYSHHRPVFADCGSAALNFSSTFKQTFNPWQYLFKFLTHKLQLQMDNQQPASLWNNPPPAVSTTHRNSLLTMLLRYYRRSWHKLDSWMANEQCVTFSFSCLKNVVRNWICYGCSHWLSTPGK
jgi:hypothetical protein